jgi:regulator of nonsense transcripts 2
MVKPPQIKAQKKAKILSPIEAYIKDLLLVRLDMKNINFVLNQILCLPWNDDVSDYGVLVVKYMLKTCRKGRYKSINAIALLAGKLKKHKSELVARLIDAVFEELQFILENPNIRDQQRAITYAKLLGELHIQMLVPVQAVIDELYHFINFDHDIPKNLYNVSSEQSAAPSISSSLLKKSSLDITQPILENEEMELEDESDGVDESKSDAIEEQVAPIGVSSHSIYDPRVPSSLDPPSAVFRIKLICTLLDCSASSLVSVATVSLVNNFLSAFQRYVFIKQTLPTDIEFSLLDTFDILESRFRALKKGSAKSSSIIRYDCWLDAHNAVITVEKATSRINERTDHRLLAQAGINSIPPDGDEGVIDEYVPLDDDDDDDDDDESFDNSVDTAEEDDISIEESEEEDSEEDRSLIDDEKNDDESIGDRDEEDEINAQEKYMWQMEDEAFEREIRMLTMEAIEKGKVSARTTAVSKVSDSMPAASQFNRKKQTQDIQNDDVGTNALALSGNDGISFQLIKRGNKGKAETKSFIIPKDTNLAKIATTRDTAADREHDMLKARVLQYEKESESTRSGDVYFDQPKVNEVRNRTLRSYDIDDEFGKTSLRSGPGRGRGNMYGGRGSLSGRGLKHF